MYKEFSLLNQNMNMVAMVTSNALFV